MKRILFILFFLFSNIVFANIGNPILDNAFNKISNASSSVTSLVIKIQIFSQKCVTELVTPNLPSHLVNAGLTKPTVLLTLSVKQSTITVDAPGPNPSYLKEV